MRLLRRKAVEEKTGLGRSSLYLKISKGEFPAPIKIGFRQSAWLESEIDTWIQSRIDATREQ